MHIVRKCEMTYFIFFISTQKTKPNLELLQMGYNDILL